jgi:hypothetical protein
MQLEVLGGIFYGIRAEHQWIEPPTAEHPSEKVVRSISLLRTPSDLLAPKLDSDGNRVAPEGEFITGDEVLKDQCPDWTRNEGCRWKQWGDSSPTESEFIESRLGDCE